MRESTDARAELYARLEGAKGQWSDQQFKIFAVVLVHIVNACCTTLHKLGSVAASAGIHTLLPLLYVLVCYGAPLLPADAPFQAGCFWITSPVDRIEYWLQILLQ